MSSPSLIPYFPLACRRTLLHPSGVTIRFLPSETYFFFLFSFLLVRVDGYLATNSLCYCCCFYFVCFLACFKTLFNVDDCVHNAVLDRLEPFYRFAQLVICGCWSKKNWSNEPSVAPATLHSNCVAQPYGLGSVWLGELSPGL